MESYREPPSQATGYHDLLLDSEMKAFLEQMNAWHQKHQDFTNRLQNLLNQKSVVLVLGKTGTGKSALINGLTGVDLEYFKHPIERTPVIDCINAELQERIEGKTKIGHSGKSETKFPIDVEDPNGSMIYYDCGGFEDTQGAGIEIQNTFYLQALASTLNKVKIVLTVTEHTVMRERQNGILSELDQITRLFCNPEFLKSSLYLVVTKGPKETEKEDVIYRLRRLTEDQPNEIIKEIVKYLIENDRIGLFSVPCEYGLIKREIFEEIRENLVRIPDGNLMNQVRMEISKSGKDLVDRVFTKLQRCITHQLAQMSEKILNQVCSKEIEIARHINEVYEFTRKLLKKTPSNFARMNNSASRSKDEILNEVKSYANNIIEIEILKEDCEELIRLVCYVEELLKISPEKNLDCTSWNDEVLALQRQLGSLMEISDKLIGSSLVLKGIVIDTRYIQKMVLKQKEQEIKRIEVYCLNKFFGDDNLVLPGIDLLIISPTWFISNDMEINLSGRDQQALPQETPLDNDDDEKKSDKDGKPGLPGGNSGNFICMGNEFMNVSWMKLVLNGGRGGQGSEGKEGECGISGIDGDFDPVKQRDTKCMISKELCYSASSVLCSMVTLNGKFNEIYESKGEVGGRGKDGGKGGCGGRGGRNGQAFISIGKGLAEIEEQIVLEADAGPDGIAGASGKGGAGGRGGKSYKATYFNEMVLPEFRDKHFWTSRSTSKRILSAPRSASRGALHAAIIAAHIPIPILLPLLTAFQLCVSSHAAIANSRWEQAPEKSFDFEESGECGKTPEEKNYFNMIDPEPNSFNGILEKMKLNEKYLEYYSETEMFKSLIKSIQ